jgi:hypothetical protein
MANSKSPIISYTPETSSPLEISPTQAHISDAFSHGSYSGADIEVYVHYPTDTSSLKGLSFQEEVIQNEISQLNESIRVATNGTQIARAYEQLKYLYAEQRKLKNAVQEVQNTTGVQNLGTIHTLSYSIFREKVPVRTLGRVYPTAYTRGPRSIGGSLIFTVINKHVFYDLLQLNLGQYNTGTSDHDKFKQTTALTDQLPPIDISLVFNNEYGASSYMGIYGLEFLQEGTTFSIEDIYSENVIQYVARDIDLMRPIGTREINEQGPTQEWSNTASNLSETFNKLNTRTRRNPFV